MSEQPDLSTLPQRMRYAATILREADKRYGYGYAYSWSPCGLESVADGWEEEDDGAAEREALIKELGTLLHDEWRRILYDGLPPKARSGESFHMLARILIKSGWRKGDPA